MAEYNIDFHFKCCPLSSGSKNVKKFGAMFPARSVLVTKSTVF